MDLIDYVASLPPIKITRLYDNPFTCQAVLRSLSSLAQQYILRLLFIEGDVPQCKSTVHVPASHAIFIIVIDQSFSRKSL